MNILPTSLRLLLALTICCASLPSTNAEQPIRVVATGARMGSNPFAAPGTLTNFWHRSPHKLGGPVGEITLGFMNWFHSSKAEVPIPNTVTLTFVWLERASTGQIVPVTFNGARQLVMAGNSVIPYVLADSIPSTAWAGSTPARDELFWVHVKGSVPAGGQVASGTPTTYPGAKFIAYDPANEPGTRDIAGAVPAISGSQSRIVGLPLLFLGRFSGPGYLAVIGIGDSILDGYGDSSNPVPSVAGYGFLNRAALDGNGANAIATFNMTRSGEAAGTWKSHHSRQEPILAFANLVVEEFGTNDIGLDGGDAKPSAIYGSIQSVWSAARGRGVQKIVRTLLLPRTTSASYNWINKADQTPNPGWGAGGARDSINSYFQTALSSGLIDSLVDTLSAVDDPTDSHYWNSNGTADWLTADGSHPSRAAHAAMATPLRAALLALTVDNIDPPTAPVASVLGNNNTIPDGDTTPSLDDRTDFGTVEMTTGAVTGTFTVQNTGSVSMTVGPVSIGGTNAADWTILTQPASSLLPGGRSSFNVRFVPGSIGPRSAVLSFTTNDPVRNPYTFAVGGTGWVASTIIKLECEDLTAVASGAAASDYVDSKCSADSFNKLEADGLNDYVEYDVTLPSAGTWDIRLLAKKASSRGKFRLFLPEANAYVGGELDQYSGSDSYVTIPIGQYSFSTAGVKKFRFLVSARNGASSGYTLGNDVIVLSR